MASHARLIAILLTVGLLATTLGPDTLAATSGARAKTLVTRLARLEARDPALADRAYVKLSAADQQLVTDYMTITEVVEEAADDVAARAPDEGVMLATVSTCLNPRTRQIYAKNRFGVTTWRYYQQQQVCIGGGGITWAWCSAWTGSTAIGYEFYGHVSYCALTLGGVGWTTIKHFSQGRYKFCAALCKSYYPWIAQQQDGEGLYWAWSGV